MNVNMLLLAADYLDSLDRGDDHGYACSREPPSAAARPPNKASLYWKRAVSTNRRRKSTSSCPRKLHNELEKHRRAQLRYRIERLKQLVPTGPDANKHTTQRLLCQSLHYIKSLEADLSEQTQTMDRLKQIQFQLRHRLRHLQAGGVDSCLDNEDDATLEDIDEQPVIVSDRLQWRQQRTVISESRCSTSSEQSELSTTSSRGSTSETDFVDVVNLLESQVTDRKYSPSLDSGFHSPSLSPTSSS